MHGECAPRGAKPALVGGRLGRVRFAATRNTVAMNVFCAGFCRNVRHRSPRIDAQFLGSVVGAYLVF